MLGVPETMASKTTTENWLDLLYSWDEGDIDLSDDNQYTEYGLRYQLANFEKTFNELENFISELSVTSDGTVQNSHRERKSGFENFDLQTVVVFCGLASNTILLALLLIGLAIKMRYFRECWRNWPRLWIVTALTLTHILLLLWIQLLKSSMYKEWSTNSNFTCLILSSLESILCFGAVLYIVLLGAHTCCQVFLPRSLIGPRQFVTWVSMTVFIWMVAIPVAIFVRRPYTGIYVSLFNKHCMMDTETGFISLIVYTYAIPFCVLFGMICSCVIGMCQLSQNNKKQQDTNHVITSDVMILRWVRTSGAWSVIFISVLTTLSFIARVPLFIVRVSQPYKFEINMDIAQTIYIGHYGLTPFCMLILKDVRELFTSLCMCCHCDCCEKEESNIETISIRVH